MNSSAYYLGEVLEQLIHRVIEDQKELKKNKLFCFLRFRKVGDAPGLDEGILVGYYIVIGKLFKAAASIGIFKALPEDLQEDITPLTLVEDLKKGDLKRICLLDKSFIRAAKDIEYGDIDLKSLFEEIITEGLALKENLTSYFDEGKMMGYSFCFDTLYVQAEFFVPELFKALPKKLRNLDPEFISYGVSYKKP